MQKFPIFEGMRKLIFVLACLFSCNLNAQSKKQQMVNLNYKLDSLTHVIVNERQDFEKEIYEKSIEISAIKNRLDELHSKNEDLSTQLAQQSEKILILEKRIAFVRDSVAAKTVYSPDQVYYKDQYLL
jgi:peptidoglycan hydrolase CwlO-like protein